MGTVERSVRRHFEREILAVRVPAPVVPAGGEAGSGRTRRRALSSDALVRIAAVIVAAGSLVLLAKDLPRETPLRQAMATMARERTYERYLPSEDSVKALIHNSFDRRGSK
jgi:hypothetical protein